ncbi:UAP56-interacting factor-like isoform X3 [Pelobates fuscus]|uniref:UAP56-interacting factor-like isoform X3 n=1 Tax=Pelobates fuscus TaxID=191477 RepID=UPI002FE454EC
MEEQDQTDPGFHPDNGKIDMSLGSNRPKFGFGIIPKYNQAGPMTRKRAANINRSRTTNQQNSNAKNTQNRSQTQVRRPQQQKYFRPAVTLVQDLTKRVNVQNRRTQFNTGQRRQRLGTPNLNRRLTQQITLNPGKRMPNARSRWQMDNGFGSTLTVSVPNQQAKQVKLPNRPGMTRTSLRFRKPAVQSKAPLPKGVPLRFNFRAMANHTSVTLNERFSSLKIKGQFATLRRSGERTVLLA